ncbi:Rieske (2Fe-2S) protein [Pedobacter alpinus]|uniref:Rieske (2Fe-2S) protein n=1 Tax=Pedobacter alpinus TaxID=1590643 RepID=A0ABW5TW52_9SPHI
MLEWLSIAKGDLLDVEIQLIEIASKKLCLIKTDDCYYATATKCPHAGADLSKGWCEKGYLVCPIHRFQYRLENGRGAEGQGDYLPVYPVKDEGDFLIIGIKKSWFKFW